MAVRSRLRWYGDQVSARVQAAAVVGVNLTLAICQAKATARAPFVTGNLRASAFTRLAIITPLGVVGAWGFSAAYAVYVELGTRYMAPRHFMRTTADEEYPQLRGRIRAALR